MPMGEPTVGKLGFAMTEEAAVEIGEEFLAAYAAQRERGVATPPGRVVVEYINALAERQSVTVAWVLPRGLTWLAGHPKLLAACYRLRPGKWPR